MHDSEPKLERVADVSSAELGVDASQGEASQQDAGSTRADDAAADHSEIEPQHPVLVPKSRRKRYRVGVGELIELRPDTVTELPADLAWQSSRSDVAVRVLEQDQARSVVVLDGPAGEVNVALQTPAANGHARTLCSWKFQIVEKAA